MSRLLASMSPEQRAELQALAEQMMQDMDLAFEVDRLGANLQRACSRRCRWGEPSLAGGGEPCRCRRRSTRWSGCHDYEDLDRSLAGRLRGRLDRRRRRGRAAPHAGRGRRPRPPPAQADRADARGGRARAAARRTARGHAARRPEDGRARARPRLRGAPARSRGRPRGARPRRPGRADGRDPAVALRRHGADRRAAHGLQRGASAVAAGRTASGSSPTTSSSSRRSSAPRPRPPCCSTCRSRCRCAGTSSTRRRWRSPCTR